MPKTTAPAIDRRITNVDDARTAAVREHLTRGHQLTAQYVIPASALQVGDRIWHEDTEVAEVRHLESYAADTEALVLLVLAGGMIWRRPARAGITLASRTEIETARTIADREATADGLATLAQLIRTGVMPLPDYSLTIHEQVEPEALLATAAQLGLTVARSGGYLRIEWCSTERRGYSPAVQMALIAKPAAPADAEGDE